MFEFWRKRKDKSKKKTEFGYCKHWKIIGDRSLTIYSDRNIDSEKAEEIVNFIERKIWIIENPEATLSEVVAEMVYQILDNKAMASLWAMEDRKLDLYVLYNF